MGSLQVQAHQNEPVEYNLAGGGSCREELEQIVHVQERLSSRRPLLTRVIHTLSAQPSQPAHTNVVQNPSVRDRLSALRSTLVAQAIAHSRDAGAIHVRVDYVFRHRTRQDSHRLHRPG